MIGWVILIYGILVAAGGIMGYTRAQSVISLVAGGVSGVLLIGAALTMMRGPYQVGWWVALIVALLLLANFGARSLSGFKMMHGGLMIILSLIAIIALIIGRNPSSV